jgi:hypothetical protein
MFGDLSFRYARRAIAPRLSIAAGLLCLAASVLVATSVTTADPIPPSDAQPEILPSEPFPAPETDAPSPCQLRLAELAAFAPSPPITGPGECTAIDVVKVSAVLLADKHRVVLSPPATLRCPMATAVAQWIADDLAPAIDALGTSLRGIETLDSFDCRPRNGVAGAQISEHGRANALDVRAFKLANGQVIEPNSASVSKPLRERLRGSACVRFSTVLGNGADAYHESHVHLDLMERRSHYKICQWDVLDPAEATALVARKAAAAAARVPPGSRHAGDVSLPRPRPVISSDAVNLPRHGAPDNPREGRMRRGLAPIALAGSLATSAAAFAEEQTVTVGPWTIATSYKGDKFEFCLMSRSQGELNIAFRRAQDGLVLLLDSPKWKLERGKTYPVRLVAGSQSIEAKALADSKAVTIALADGSFTSRLRHAEVLEVRGEGSTVSVPLTESTTALRRLEACFDKNSRNGVETNPFVAHSRSP